MTSDDIAELVARASVPAESGESSADRRRALTALVPALGRSARTAGVRAVLAGRWLADEIVEIAPRVPVRDAATLRGQYPDLSDIEIAERLVKSASRTTAALGAAAGGIAAVEFTAPPALLAAPVQLAAEMLVVAAVELKLVAELHEVLGQPAPGGITDRSGAYLLSWVRRRGVTTEVGATGLAAVFGTAAKREVRSHILHRLGRSTFTLAPFLAGAVAGAEVNRRATRSLGEALLTDLRSRSPQRWFRVLGRPDSASG